MQGSTKNATGEYRTTDISSSYHLQLVKQGLQQGAMEETMQVFPYQPEREKYFRNNHWNRAKIIIKKKIVRKRCNHLKQGTIFSIDLYCETLRVS